MKKLTTEQFITKSNRIHGNKYDYSKVIYTKSNEQVQILCPVHEDFYQRANDHLQGYGCPICGIERRANSRRTSLQQFIHQASKIHHNKYDYSTTIYTNNITLVNIKCPIHGIFTQSPDNHLHNHGCPTCADELHSHKQIKQLNAFVSQANLVHNNKYNYKRVVYKGTHRKVIITCNSHGNFKQTPCSHLRGRGCPICSPSFSKSAVNWLNTIMEKENIYIQHAENGGEFKIPGTKYKADGYCEATNTIYEFHGNYWHGNPTKYTKTTYNTTSKTTMGELYNRTIRRDIKIKKLGYNLVVKWEN